MSDQIEVRGPRFGIVPSPVVRDGSITTTARTLFAILCTYANAGREAWPSKARLAHELGSSERTLRRALEELQAFGCLWITPRTAPDGGSLPNLYDLRPAFGGMDTSDHPGGGTSAGGGTAPAPPKQTKRTEKDPPVSPPTDSFEREELVLGAFNAKFGTSYSSDSFLRRIRRRWPKGWELKEWQTAINGLARHPEPYWHPEKPNPGHLIGRDGSELEVNYLRGKGGSSPAGAVQPGAVNQPQRKMSPAAQAAMEEAIRKATPEGGE